MWALYLVLKAWFDKWFDVHGWVEYVGGWAISRGAFLCALYVGLLGVLAHQIPNLETFAFNWLVGTSPIWLPISLYIIGWHTWLNYIESLTLSKRDPVLLEMKVPQEVLKSPRGMELVFGNLNNTGGETTFIHRAWKGGLRPFFSLEYVSFGGEVHMYIQTPRFFREQLEAFIYAEYPEVEMVQVEDYAAKFKFDPKKHSCFCTNYKLANDDVFPIKTYIEYELDHNPDEKFKVDPLGDVLGFLSALNPNEQIWIQITIQGHGDSGIFTRVKSNWAKRVAQYAVKIRNASLLRDPNPTDDPALLEKEETKKEFFRVEKLDDTALPSYTWKQQEQINAIERNGAKFPFDVGFRGIYISDVSKGAFRPPMFMRLRQLFFPFNARHLNSIVPTGGSNGFDYPWQDWNGMRNILMCRRYFDMMRRRSYFHRPWQTKAYVMSNESLATLFHPPSIIVTAHGFGRIQGKRAAPPLNLPTA